MKLTKPGTVFVFGGIDDCEIISEGDGVFIFGRAKDCRIMAESGMIMVGTAVSEQGFFSRSFLGTVYGDLEATTPDSRFDMKSKTLKVENWPSMNESLSI